MKPLNLKISFLSIICFAFTSFYCSAQQGNVTVNQDKNITTLLNLKKEMNKNEEDPSRYKIQIYSGNRADAKSAQKEFRNSFTVWNPTIQYEPPNFKIWVGNFRTRLEADRALKKVKKKFPHAFIFKPKKKKN
ncbi:SPOR domain-containing protein [Flavivirga spongiicola]|uniref:SPOR domain-containing protein n=1 Tax=Flavivirga spongiicola TaxID=421621 RepID=A0ABU7XVE4_9FLAO|nr:SPOR domain-containing protein [Flavivirga sp. MEBiC05379]MDO5979410.1 SPOR domain-containing protein [Flavivirga sp. MEBiC05379]